MLISGGRGLYHRLGYVTVGEFRRVTVLRPPQAHQDPSPGARLDVSPMAAEELEAVMSLHRGEPVRFVRPREDWEALLRVGRLMIRPAELLVVRQAGEPVAYVAVQVPRPDAEGRLPPARVRELAGSRWAIAEALPAAMERVGAAEIDVVTHAHDREWTTLARARGWTLEPTAFTGTIGILDPAAFFDRLEPYIAERLSERRRLRIQPSTAGVRFELGGQSYEVTAPGPLAALIFGGHTEEARAIPPLSGELGRALASLFPLPLLWYGYNYV
jgi:hypothetical protein